MSLNFLKKGIGVLHLLMESEETFFETAFNHMNDTTNHVLNTVTQDF